MYTPVYTTLCTPPTPWVYPHTLTYPGVPVPPYTGMALPDDRALGSNLKKDMGRSFP